VAAGQAADRLRIMLSNSQNSSTDDAPLVVAVVLNWNGGAMNRTCLDALLSCGYPRLDVVFVDNGSNDGSGEEVKLRYPRIEHIFTGHNLGFTGGNNLGIKRALEKNPGMILILNNDVEVRPGFLEPMVGILKEQPGIAGPMTLDTGGNLWCAGGVLAFHQNLTRLRGFGQADGSRYNRTESVDYMPGSCLLVSSEVFEAVGPLNEEYFCYLEDVEFCVRAGRAGFSTNFCPSSTVLHHFSHSTGGGYSPARKYMNAVNSVRFLRSYGTARSWAAFLLFDVLAWPFVFIHGAFRGRARGVLAKGRGIMKGLLGGTVSSSDVEAFLAGKEKAR